MRDSVDVLIVDDQIRARQSLKALLVTVPQVAGVQEAGTGKEALEIIEKHRPDVVLMDVRMPEMDGLAATRSLKARWPEVRVVVLSMYPEYRDEALAAGADAFVAKGEPTTRLLGYLARAASGGWEATS